MRCEKFWLQKELILVGFWLSKVRWIGFFCLGRKPNQDQFLLQANFSHLIFYTFVTIPYQDCTKTITSLIHQFCFQGKKKPIHRTWLRKTQPRSIPFATELFTPHFLCICDNSPPILHKSHNFTFAPILLPRQKKPIHRTWLSQNPTKINSFCNQTFHTSFFMHLWQLPTKIGQKP